MITAISLSLKTCTLRAAPVRLKLSPRHRTASGVMPIWSAQPITVSGPLNHWLRVNAQCRTRRLKSRDMSGGGSMAAQRSPQRHPPQRLQLNRQPQHLWPRRGGSIFICKSGRRGCSCYKGGRDCRFRDHDALLIFDGRKSKSEGMVPHYELYL